VVLSQKREFLPAPQFTAMLRTHAQSVAPGVVTHLQRNFIYHTALNLPQNLPVLPQGDATVVATDNPAIQPPDANPQRGNDPQMSAQWGLGKIHAEEAWGTQRGSKDVIVAVIDTGVDYNHEDLRNALWRNPGEIPGNGIDDDDNGFVDDVVGWDFAKNDALPYDMTSQMRIDGNPGHGTHCSGVVGGVGNNAIGISGVAPNVSVMGVRFISESGEGTTADGVKAISYALANGAKVLSNSWGGEKDAEPDDELRAVIQNAMAQDVLFIFAAGNGRNGVGYNNDTDSKPMIPASYEFDNIVSVAAIDSNNALGSFSNWGVNSVDLAAPGVKVMSSVPGNQYEDQIKLFGFPLAYWSGTSMATPHVAGAVALIWSQFPNATWQEVKAKLLASVTPASSLSGKVKTGGILNAQAALQQ
jgi:subtilisin family serine protease